MARSYSDLRDLIEVKLWDSANSIWTTAILDSLMLEAVSTMSRYAPRMVKHGFTTDGTTRRLTIGSEDKWKMLWPLDWCEYKVDKIPEARHNITVLGDIVTLDIDTTPGASEAVNIWMSHKHLLQQAIGTTDTAAAIKTQAAAGVTSLALKSLGTGTINEDTTLTIAGDTTTYYVTATATIAANEATVSIFPKLAAVAAVDAVVTLALTASTLTPQLEELLVELVVSEAIVDNRAGAKESAVYAERRQAKAMDRLNHLAEGKTTMVYPRAV